MWLYDSDGDLINSDHIVFIEARAGRGSKWILVAHTTPTGGEGTGSEVVLVELQSGEVVDKAMKMLAQKLGAAKVW